MCSIFSNLSKNVLIILELAITFYTKSKILFLQLAYLLQLFFHFNNWSNNDFGHFETLNIINW